jgi:hypothetical protein
VTFRIGRQEGGVINNVGGDQRVAGGPPGCLTVTGHIPGALDDLRRALPAAGLAASTATAAHAQVAEMDAALSGAHPDRARFARALEQLTRLLTAAGSLATAGMALISPLHALASWLGTAGEPVLRMLPPC